MVTGDARPAGPALAADDALLSAQGVYTRFITPHGVLPAVADVSFVVRAGQSVGIVGESGSGKSVLARTIYGLHSSGPRTDTGGSVFFRGRDLSMLDRRQRREIWGSGMAIVLQDPMTSLNPVVRIGRQITEHVRIKQRLSKRDAWALGVDLLTGLGVPDPSRRMTEYPHQLSGGLRQRVAIAAALAGAPDLLIADEPTTALDVTIQAQILQLLGDARRRDGVALILITHDLGIVADHTDYVLVMYAGRVVERAPTADLFREPHMPYTAALMQSAPRLADPPHTPLRAIPGQPPALDKLSGGCAFAPRCAYARDRCHAERPPLVAAQQSRAYACWYPLGLPATDAEAQAVAS